MNRCPGNSSSRSLDSIVIICSCGKEVEIFSDEQKRRCFCGRNVYQKTIPQCADWCPSAKLCLGLI
jgi:hypothetical protein